jgi:hypothetical protein
MHKRLFTRVAALVLILLGAIIGCKKGERQVVPAR